MKTIESIREAFEIYEAEDHEVIDIALDIISQQERKPYELNTIKSGETAHRITLTKQAPATVIQVELNIVLEEDVYLSQFNILAGVDYEDPGSWFVRKQFIVRSKKENGNWVQYAFKNVGASNVTRSEVIDYLEVAGMPYDSNNISDFGPTIFFRPDKN